MRKKRAFYNLITSIALQIVSIICGLIVPKLIIATYGSNLNGLINSITQFLSYIALLEVGFGPVILSILYKPIANKDKNKIKKILKSSELFFRKISFIFIIYIIILCFVYPVFVNSNYDSLFIISLIIIISLSTFAEYFFGLTYSIYLQADQKKYIISIVRLVTTIINTILICILVKNNCNILLVKLISTLVYVSRPIIQYMYVKRKYKINLKNVKEKEEIKEKWDGLSQHIAGTIYSSTDVTLLSFFSNMREVSVYSVYNMIISAVKNFISILTGSVEAGFGDMIAKKEKDNLNEKFDIYEFIYFTTITIVYSCTAVLIVPFIKVYTTGITDANYVRNAFAFILVTAAFVHAIKSIYNTLAFTAGKFKETHRGSWLEALSNLLISFCLVFKFGVVGVAIGTLVSVFIRCIEFMVFTSKNVLNRSIKKTIFRVFLCVIQYFTIYFAGKIILDINVTSYLSWILWAVIMVFISIVVVLSSNVIFYKKEFNYFLTIIKNEFKKVK